MILIAVAAAATAAHLRGALIAGIMLLAWAVVAFLEWAFLQNESHWGSGLPPRYYVPPLRVSEPARERAPLPPPLEHPAWPRAPGVPEPVVAAAQLREEDATLADWFVEQEPVVAAVPDAPTLIEEPEPKREPPKVVELRPREPVTSWFDAELPGAQSAPPPVDDARFSEPHLEELETPATPESAPALEAEAPVLPEPVEEAVEPEVDYRRLAAELRSLAPVEPDWFDSELPGAAADVPPAADGDRFYLELFEGLEQAQDAASLPEPAAEPAAPVEQELDLVTDEVEVEPEIDYARLAEELRAAEPAERDWFVSELPGGAIESTSAADDARIYLELLEELDAAAQEAPGEPEQTPAAEVAPAGEEAAHADDELEAEVDFRRFAEELRAAAPSEPDWFDTELPGGASPEPSPELEDEDARFQAALAELEAEWARQSLAAAEPEHRPEPEPEARPVPDEPELELDVDYKLLARQLRAELPSSAPWFDAQLPGAASTGGAGLAAQTVEAEAAAETRTSRHRLDPYGDSKRFWQRHEDDGGVVEVPARPPGRRLLPGRSKRDN